MSIQHVQDEEVPIAAVPDDAARYDFALRAHPEYRTAPQVHLQATVYFRGARPIASTFAAALLATFFARGADPIVGLYVLGGGLAIGLMGGIGVSLLTLVFVGVRQQLGLVELTWCGAGMMALYLCRNRTFTAVIPPDIGLDGWAELKNDVNVLLGGDNRVKRGTHTIGYAAYTLLSAAPFCAMGVLCGALGNIYGPLIGLALGLTLPRLAVSSTAASDDLVLAANALGFDPAAEATFAVNRTNIVAVVSALAVLATLHAQQPLILQGN